MIQDIFNLLIYSRIVIVDFSGRNSNFILIEDRNRHISDFHVAPSRLAEASHSMNMIKFRLIGSRQTFRLYAQMRNPLERNSTQ